MLLRFVQDNDQQLESASSSIDGGTETSDDGTGASVERATPCSNVTRSSSAGAAVSDKVSSVGVIFACKREEERSSCVNEAVKILNVNNYRHKVKWCCDDSSAGNTMHSSVKKVFAPMYV